MKFWRWQNAIEGSPRTLFIGGPIDGEVWWGDEVTPNRFREELAAGAGPIDLYINSPGGDCTAASQIYTMLVEYPGKVTVKIDGTAASAASVIAMAGDSVLMARTAMMMIHDPSTVVWGDRKEMEKAIDVLSEVKESIINAYEKKTGLSRARLDHLMSAETWMNAKKAIELGFADGMIGEDDDGAEPTAFEAKTTRDAMMKRAEAMARQKNGEPKTEKTYDDLLARLNKIKYSN